jgi:hypothetical protein
MKPLNHAERKEKITLFSILLFLASAVSFLLLTSLVQKENKVMAATTKTINNFDVQESKIVQYNEILHGLLASLQQLDKQFAAKLSNSASNKFLDSLNIVIHQEEEYLISTIDRISKDGVEITDPGRKKQVEKMITFFKSIVADREAISILRNAVAFKKTSIITSEGDIETHDESELGNESLTNLSNP